MKCACFAVKSFKYQEKLNVKLAELGFYITKLAKVTKFNLKYLYKATYQGQILEWKQKYAESQNRGHSYISNPFKHILWDLRSRKDKAKKEVTLPSRDNFEE